MSEELEQTIARRINWAGFAIAIGLIANLMAGSWFASNLNSRVEKLEESVASNRSDRELLVRMDERTRVMADDINELKKRVGDK